MPEVILLIKILTKIKMEYNNPGQRNEFVQYLRGCMSISTQEMQSQAGDILRNIRSYISPHLAIDGSELLSSYYASAVSGLEVASGLGDFFEGFPDALEELAQRLELE
jgi:hypothetical protein